MKTLITTLKLIPVLLLITFSACKKDGGTSEKDGTFLKGYYIAGKYPATLSGQTLQLPYIIRFFANAKVTLNNGYQNSQGKYSYKNNVLTITWDSPHIDTFKITDKTINNFSGTSKLTAYSLQQTPADNQLNASSYTGLITAVPGNYPFPLTVKFSSSQYATLYDGLPPINADYTLLNNAAATSQNGNNGTTTFFVLIGGTLEMASYTVSGGNGQVSVIYGSMTKS